MVAVPHNQYDHLEDIVDGKTIVESKCHICGSLFKGNTARLICRSCSISDGDNVLIDNEIMAIVRKRFVVESIVEVNGKLWTIKTSRLTKN